MGQTGHQKGSKQAAARASIALSALALFCLALASQAQAAPSHPRLEALDITGLNHACGAAVDSKGDVYASSAGESKVKVFNEAHTEIGSIANASEPCALAVDSQGNLYVSEAKTGNVVKYHPTAYPFAGAPSYEAAKTIDASGKAKGISVDPTDDSLYVAEGTRVTIYKADGSLFTGNELQALRFSGEPSGGTYKLSFEGSETAPLPYNASAADIKAALEALPAIGAGNVEVPNEQAINFVGSLAATNVPQLGADDSALVGGSAKVATRLNGFDGDLGEGDLTNATGVASDTLPGPVSSRRISVAEPATGEIKLFAGQMSLGAIGGFPGTLEPRGAIDGSETPEGELGLAAGAYLGVDNETGHLFAYDATHKVLNEFEATGRYFTQVASPEFADAQPTAVAIDPQYNEIQRVTVHASGGSFQLEFEGEKTAAIPFSPNGLQPRKTQEILEALASIGVRNVAVATASSGLPETAIFVVRFVGTLDNKDVEQLSADGSGLTGGAATVSVSTERQGRGPGHLYVSAGASASAKLLAFGSSPAPGRANIPSLSHQFNKACGTVVDSQGDVYVAGNTKVAIYGPGGSELGFFEDAAHPCRLAVDSVGNLYVANRGVKLHANPNQENVSLYKPSAYPFSGTPSYATPKVIQPGEEGGHVLHPIGIAVNPANDHLFVSNAETSVREYASAAAGSGLLELEFCGVQGSSLGSIDVDGANGDVYVLISQGATHEIDVCSPDGSKVLDRIDGSDGHEGEFTNLNPSDPLAVDQSNGHVLVFPSQRGNVEEYDASGAFVGVVGSFTRLNSIEADMAVDNSGDANDGDLYVAYDDPANASDLTAFGPLTYGEAPLAHTGVASATGGGETTLEGAVDPRGFEVEECVFEYLSEAEYEANAQAKKPSFAGAESAACEEPDAGGIGEGTQPVSVHARISGVDLETTRYRFRLVAANKFGESQGDAGLFGPPLVATGRALPILYREATVHGEVDPSGLATEYHFEYLSEAEYEEGGESFATAQSTPAKTLPAGGEGPSEVKAALTGLLEGTAYRFRLVATSEAATAMGEDKPFVTQQRHPRLSCPNDTLRLENNSSNLPDCRAYELVTPADTRNTPHAEEFTGPGFNNWLVTPSGPLAGGSLAFFLKFTSLPEAEGSGTREGFRASRSATGWNSAHFGPSYAQNGELGEPTNGGTAADQLYSFWHIDAIVPGTLPAGNYLSTPSGVANPTCLPEGASAEEFELLGCGEEGTDPKAEFGYVSAGGSHVIFRSKAHLAPAAPLQGTQAVYDREAGSPEARVVSVKPNGSSFGAGEDARYQGATPDGSSVAFSAAGKLYLRFHSSETIQVATNASFSGISEDGERVFYTDNGNALDAAGLWVCQVEAGACTASEIATNARFAVVSADGSHAYFVKEGGLYDWNGSGTSLIAPLDLEDLSKTGFPGTSSIQGPSLGAWTASCVGLSEGANGRATCPLRTTPDGRFLVFQSHADLTEYEGNGHSEIYRYDSEDGSLLCASCDPSGAPASAEADLQAYPAIDETTGAVQATTLIPGVTDDGSEVFFQTAAALLPEDANSVLDVYEWQARGSGGCIREGGCLALISSGQGGTPSTIYSMTPDGHDVFFSTFEKLTGSDIPGSASIYDARVEGGFPAVVEKEPCHGDACQGEGSEAPERPSINTSTPGSGNVEEAPVPVPCAKGKHRVKGRCVAKHHRKRHHRAKRNRRAGR